MIYPILTTFPFLYLSVVSKQNNKMCIFFSPNTMVKIKQKKFNLIIYKPKKLQTNYFVQIILFIKINCLFDFNDSFVFVLNMNKVCLMF